MAGNNGGAKSVANHLLLEVKEIAVAYAEAGAEGGPHALGGSEGSK